MYTDGSKSDEGVGSAVFVPSENFSKTLSLPKEASIFTAEAVAVLLAIKVAGKMLDEECTRYTNSNLS